MSTIFKAEDLSNERAIVAVKVPLPMFASGVGPWSLFQREEEIGLRLNHPYVLRYLPLPPAKRRSYIVTEFVSGRTLAARLKEHHPLPEDEAVRIGSRVCEALEHLHERDVVHYDVKPANVILCTDGTIRLIDFGLAHAAVTKWFALAGALPAVGSVDYLAPEQIQRKPGRKSVDIYGLGAMLYEMLTGRPPFPDGDPSSAMTARILGDPQAPRELNASISVAMEDVVLRALRRNPTERYPSMAAMRADLEHLDQMVVLGFRSRLRPVTRLRRWLRVARTVAIVGVLPLALQVLLFLLLWYHFRKR